MLKPFLGLLTFCFTFFTTVNTQYNSTGPTWIPSPYFRAGNNKVITSTTGAGQVKIYTFTFSSALSGTPNLAYGVKNYRGQDTMKTQSFEILRVNLTSSQFTVSIQIFGITNIWVFTVPYLAIDPQFPHHLNSFDNVPINYNSGSLVNITSFSTSPTFYTNTINYTLQSITNKYKSFTDPISSNKIVLFLTSFEINATASVPMDFAVTVSVINQSHYKWTVTINSRAYIGKVHFSQIIYNEIDVMSSKMYMIVFQEWTAYLASNYSYVQFPQQLTDNMITALVDFNAIVGDCGLQYNWQFVSNFSGKPYVIYFNISDPLYISCGFNRTRSSIFYIKTWKCGAPYIYFNLTTDSCQNGCADYFYENATAGTCDACYYTCIDCSRGNDPDACTVCQGGFNRSLSNGSCVCNSGYFDDWYSLNCRVCSAVDPNCFVCSYPYDPSKNYSSIFSTITWSTNIKPDYACTLCDTSYFLNSSNLCQLCTLNYCTKCASATQCQTCNSSLNVTHYTDGLCYLCNVPHCTMCSSNNFCTTCTTSYFFSNGSCLSCSQICTCDGWYLPRLTDGTCSTLCGDGFMLGTEECDDGNTNDHDGCSSTCTIEACNASCACDGWTQPWQNGECSTICGDSLIRGQQTCDDGNTDDFDGCSSVCQIEPCDVSCLCDGWILPRINQTCTALCGDGLVRGEEQCDDSNQLNFDQCQNNCTWHIIPQPQVPVLLSASMSSYPVLAIMVLGLRIVGLEALNVFQSFQLLLFTHDVDTFDLSFNVHGYADSTHFPLSIPTQNHIFTHFNFMYIALMAFFILGAGLELFRKVSTHKNKILNNFSYLYDDKTVKAASQCKSERASEESNSQDMVDFAVHCKTKNRTKKIINIIEPYGQKSQNILPLTLEESKSGSIFFRQIFFDLVVNCQYIFVYGLTTQIMEEEVHSFLNFSVIVIIGTMGFILVLVLLISSVENDGFGQNQLKFNLQKPTIYWMMVFFERITVAVLLALSAKYQQSIYAILGVKFALLIFYTFSDLYVKRIQKIRSVVTHFLHFLLILSFVLNKLIFQPRKMLHSISLNFIEYTYLGILSLVLIISLCFYVREIIHKCQADFREQNDPARDGKHHLSPQGSAIFDVKETFSIYEMPQMPNGSLKRKNNIFDDLKTMNYIPKSRVNISNPGNSGSSTPIRYSAKSKKVLSTNYLNFLKQSSTQSFGAPISTQSKVSYRKHRRHYLQSKQNIFDEDYNKNNEVMMFTPSKSRWDVNQNDSNYMSQYVEQEPDDSRLRPSIQMSVIRPDDFQYSDYTTPIKSKGVVREIRRIGLKGKKKKNQNNFVMSKQAIVQDEKDHSASDLIKVDDFDAKYSTTTNIFKDPLKSHKKKTLGHKRFKQIKKAVNNDDDELSINMD